MLHEFDQQQGQFRRQWSYLFFLSFAIQLSALIKQMWIIRFSVGKSVDIQKMEHRQNQREEFGSAIFLIETQILILISMLFAGFFFIL